MTVSGRLAVVTLVAASGLGLLVGMASSPGTGDPSRPFPSRNDAVVVVAVSNNSETQASE